MDDWLEEGHERIADSLFDPGAAELSREEQHARAVEVAQLYLLFVDSERGRALLEMWDRVELRKRTPINADVQQYAADEAVRAFVAGIHDQIAMAQSR